MVRIKVIKGFYYNGEPLKKDQEIDVPRLFAIDMIAGNRAIEVKVAPPEPEIVKEKPPDEKPAGAEKKAHSTK